MDGSSRAQSLVLRCKQFTDGVMCKTRNRLRVLYSLEVGSVFYSLPKKLEREILPQGISKQLDESAFSIELSLEKGFHCNCEELHWLRSIRSVPEYVPVVSSIPYRTRSSGQIIPQGKMLERVLCGEELHSSLIMKLNPDERENVTQNKN